MIPSPRILRGLSTAAKEAVETLSSNSKAIGLGVSVFGTGCVGMWTIRVDLKGDMAAMRGDLKGDIVAMRGDLKGDMAALESRMAASESRIKGDMAASESRLMEAIKGRGKWF